MISGIAAQSRFHEPCLTVVGWVEPTNGNVLEVMRIGGFHPPYDIDFQPFRDSRSETLREAFLSPRRGRPCRSLGRQPQDLGHHPNLSPEPAERATSASPLLPRSCRPLRGLSSRDRVPFILGLTP